MIQLITILLFDKKEKKKEEICEMCTMYNVPISVEEQLRLLFFFYEET